MVRSIKVQVVSLVLLVAGPAIAQIASGSEATSQRCGTPLYATVRSGASLADIAREAGHSWRDVARWNSLDGTIAVGQVLRVQPPECGAGKPLAQTGTKQPPAVRNAVAPTPSTANALCNELSQMIAFAANDFADLKGIPIPETKPAEYRPRQTFPSFENCRVRDPRSPELDSPEISCRVKGMDDRGGRDGKFSMDEELHTQLWSLATASAESISACLPTQPRTSEVEVKDRNRRTYFKWIVDLKGRDNAKVPIALTLLGRVALAGQSVEWYESPGIATLVVEHDKAEVIVRQAEDAIEEMKRQRAALPASPSKDTKWKGPGWYQVAAIMGDPEIRSGPFSNKSACMRTLPTYDDDEFVDFFCNLYDTNSKW